MAKLRGREAKAQNPFLSVTEQAEDDEEAQLDAVFTDVQLQELESNERTINQRSKDIAKIADSINALATMFKELQTMVIDQGTILDRIDYNIEQTQVYVQDAHEELVKVC
jgi:syntaxin 16